MSLPADIRELAASGLCQKEIAERLGVHRKTVAKFCKSNGIEVLPFWRKGMAQIGGTKPVERKMVTQARLMELLHYDPESGAFVYLQSRGRLKAGHTAKKPRVDGYIWLMVDKKSYPAHRLAWLYVYGAWPKTACLDHIDGDRANNRIANLREATRSQNQQNIKRAPRTSSSGLLGAKRDSGGWQASITVNGRRIYLGHFTSPEKAHEAYVAAKRQHHPFGTL